MRKKGLLMLLAMFIIGFSACSDDDNESPNKGGGSNLEVTLSAKPEIVSFVSTSVDSCKLYIEGNAKWRIKASVDWCTFSKYTGEGADEVTVYVGDNDQVDKRSGEIIITGAEEPLKVPVVQFGRGVQFLTFIGGEEVKGNVAELDFESRIYRFSFLSNVNFDATLDPAAKGAWIQENAQNDNVGESTYPGYAKGRWIEVYLDDNKGPERETFYVLKHSGGSATDTVYIRQEAYRPFLRFASDTIYVGSHFRQLNLSGWGDVNWKYEFLDEEGHVAAAPSWMKNVHPREKSAMRLGTSQTLTGDLEENLDSQPRHARVRFFYTVNGQPMENIITVVQRENNPWVSDSLALMRIAEYNASESGLVVSWTLGEPMETWPDLGWIVDENGQKRVDIVMLGGAYMINDLTPDICNLSALKVLTLSQNYLTGLPEEIGLLDQLIELNITDNFNDNSADGPESGIKELPASLFTGCTKLKILKCSKNRLTKVPAGIGQLTELEELDLSANKITEFPLNEMRSLEKLTSLRLGYNPYSGNFPEFIFSLPKLLSVNMDHLDFKGAALPDRFASLPELQQFSANGCNIGGELPVSLAQCTNLENFTIEASADATAWLSGELPPEYGQLNRLQGISLADNKITGNLPVEWLNLLDVYKRTGHRFLFIYVRGNCMSGTIPQDFLEHPSWTNEKVEWNGEEVKIGAMTPQTEICPQRDGFGFTNCPVK